MNVLVLKLYSFVTATSLPSKEKSEFWGKKIKKNPNSAAYTGLKGKYDGQSMTVCYRLRNIIIGVSASKENIVTVLLKSDGSPYNK